MSRIAPFLSLVLMTGCGYYYYSAPLHPAASQSASMETADDGSVIFVRGGLRIRLKPMTDEELNRLFASNSLDGVHSTNPFTFGNTVFWDTDRSRQRFTVFQLQVTNEEYPKVRLDPARIVVRADNGREYWSLSFGQLDAYYRAYAVGYRGNEYSRYQERRDLLKRSLFSNEEIFRGQSMNRYVVFPMLHPDVRSVDVQMYDVALRFDYRNEPVEATDLAFRFARDIGRMYRDGRVVLNRD